MHVPHQFLDGLTAGDTSAAQRRAADEQLGRMAAAVTRSASRLRSRLGARPRRRSPHTTRERSPYATREIGYWYVTPSGRVPWSLRYSSAARTEKAANGHSSRGTSV